MPKETKKWLPDPTVWKGTWREDWRIMGQEGYLMEKQLEYRQYDREIAIEDFVQCEFCWNTFDDEPQKIKNAYFEPHKKVWICEKCFRDFQRYFHWTVTEVLTEPDKSEEQSAPRDSEYRNSSKGVYYNEKTGECWHPDLDCPDPIGPHWDYNYKGSGISGWRVYKDKEIKQR